MPALPSEQRASGSLQLRYEDVVQDGRLHLNALPNAYSGPIWEDLLGQHPAARKTRGQGIIPILSRLVLIGHPGPFSPVKTFTTEAGFDLAHSRSEGGEIERIVLRVWGSLLAPHGTLLGGTPRDAPLAKAGEAYAEHVFTRLFAPPEQRKVRSLGVSELADPPGPLIPIAPPDDVLALPEGARWLDDTLIADRVETCFSLGHTDSNQHVNSLVYPRLFDEAALRRLSSHGISTMLLARSIESSFRKPCFAGERVRFWLRTFLTDAGPGAAGLLLPDGVDAASAQPRANGYFRVFYET